MSWYSKWKDDRKSKKETSSKSFASSFWYDDYYDTGFDYLETYGGYQKTEIEAYKKTHNLYKLASVRRAIANFVHIVTGKSIPVSFATKSDSQTDGKKVILSADVDDHFDVSVGLALHEGSHIVLSDFGMLTAIGETESRYRSILANDKYNVANKGSAPLTDTDIDKFIKATIDNYPKYSNQLSDIFLSTGRIGSKGRVTEEVMNFIRAMQNWIEDRRIDHFIYKHSPGYRDYYVSMYDHYFNDKAVTKGVASEEFTTETWESYLFRIINLMNENTTLSKLKGLRNVYRILNLNNIQRLQSSGDSLSLSIDIVEEILKHVGMDGTPLGPQPTNGNGYGNGSGNGQSDIEITDIVESDGSDKGDQMGSTPDINGKIQATASVSNDPSDKDGLPSDTKVTLSKTALEQLKKRFEKQKDFLNGDIKKKKITKQENDKLDSIDESDTELVRVGGDVRGVTGKVGRGVDCVVVRKLTDKILNDSDFPFTNTDWQSGLAIDHYTNEVNRGIVLGTILGKKLQIRSESRETIFNRLKKGKIDKRALSALGYGNESVFFTHEIDQYKKANIHISIDYSGSMSGKKIRRAIIATVAIVKACQMARNINVQVSVRSTERGGNSASLPYIVMVHDSRRDSFRQFCKYMAKLDTSNTTPEGLCFEAIYKQLIPTTNDVDSYFLNFSDGAPYYHISSAADNVLYSGYDAAEHTNKQVKRMRESGLHILSYFITDSNRNFEQSEDWNIFKKCYDRDAKYVDVENMFEVAKTMNEMFLNK